MNTDTINKRLQHWHSSTDDQDILWLAINVKDSTTNSLSAAVLEELDTVLAEIEQDLPSALVIHSAKSSGFIAGADINEFETLDNEAAANALITRGQAVISRLAALPVPSIAVIDGFCLGGGLELALACDYRLVIDDPATRLGLPEIKLGIHPGFGGTVRSIDAAGSVTAMQLMLTGRTISAKQAKRMGLVHERIPRRQIQNTVLWYQQNQPAAKPLKLQEKLLRTLPARKLFAAYLRKQTRKKANPEHYPAPYKLINLWEKHVGNNNDMLAAEAASVANLITSSTSKNLVRVFKLQEHLKSHGDKKAFVPHHVHVVGAGTMGGDIALWCALNGLQVTVEDSNHSALAATVKRASQLYAKRFRDYPHLKTAAMDRLLPDPKGRGRKKADIIIEAIYENLAAKQTLFSELEKVAQPGAILASNTSSIPLEKIASVMKEPSRLVGLHFFNPVAKMPLVEVVYSSATDAHALSSASAFTRHIGKLPLPVKSSPGFLVNRVLMPYLLEAGKLFDEQVGIAEIDRAAKAFGMPMGPLELADTVGLDVCLNVAEELAEPMQLTIPESIKSLVAKKQLGKKTGQGFYQYTKGKRIALNASRESTPENQANIQERLISKLLEESTRCLEDNIVANAKDVDAGVIFGTGFAPFTGGPLNYKKSQKKRTL